VKLAIFTFSEEFRTDITVQLKKRTEESSDDKMFLEICESVETDY
jgi:hypothetical protein